MEIADSYLSPRKQRFLAQLTETERPAFMTILKIANQPGRSEPLRIWQTLESMVTSTLSDLLHGNLRTFQALLGINRKIGEDIALYGRPWIKSAPVSLPSGEPSTLKDSPGTLLAASAGFIFSAKTNERIFKPIISDMQIEYWKAVAAGLCVKANWVRVRGYWSFFKAIGLYSIMKTLVEMWRNVTSV
jgi:hypothetical protein